MAIGFSERVQWSKETYSLSELVQRFESQFPVIVNTLSGFYGANEVEVISTGQIIRVHSVANQQRVFARDVRGRIFSLPLTLTVKFEVLKEHGRRSRPKRLVEILSKYELPTRVAFADHGKFSFSVGEMRYDSGQLGTLTLYKVYEETFLRISSIARGVINKNVMLLPLYVQVQVSLAKGFKDGQMEDWKSLMQMYDRSIGPSKITTIKGLDDILVYDPTDGDVINPQAIPKAMSSRQILRTTSMLVEGFDSDRRKDSLFDRLSALKIFGNREGNRTAKSFTENRSDATNRPYSGSKIVQSNLTVIDLREDEFVPNELEAETSTRKTTQNLSSEIQNSRSTKITLSPADDESRMEHEVSNQMSTFHKEDGEERETNIRANIEVRGRKVLDSGTEEINSGENQPEIQFSRPKPLERPIPAKRTSAPTGRVTPMVKESSNAGRNTDISETEVNRTGNGANAEFSIMADNVALKNKEREEKSVIALEVMEMRSPLNDSANTDHWNVVDGNKSFPRQTHIQAVEAFNHATVRTPSRSKKSSLKANLRQNSRPTMRHVSYSDTDTVYPFDSHDDMADDDNDVDNPFYSNNMAVILDEHLGRRPTIAESRNQHTLPGLSRRQTESMVVSGVLPTTSTSVRKKNSLPSRRKHFSVSDTNIFSRSSAALSQYPSVGVIQEAYEEYQTVPTSSSILRQYDAAASRTRIGDLDTSGKYGSSVINVGNVRSDGGLVLRRQRSEPAMLNAGDNGFFIPNYDALPRRKSTYRATTLNRKPVPAWKQDVTPYGGRYDSQTLMPANTNQKRNGATLLPPQKAHGRPASNFSNYPTRAAENLQNSTGKVIRLNETRDGNTWDEISDYEVEKLDPYSRKVTTSTLARPPDPKYTIRYATKGSRSRDVIDGQFPSPGMGNGKNHFTYMSTPGSVTTVAVHSPERGRNGFQGRTQSMYGATREAIPRVYMHTDNQNVTRRVGVVTPTVVLMEKTRPVKKAVLSLE